MKAKTIISALSLLVSCTALAQSGKVHLHGKLIDQGSTEVTMSYDGAAGYLGASRKVIINTDKDGNFDTTITIDRPEYYSICRNTMYLTPGDDLEIYITTDNKEAKFTGRGAEANEYMKHRLFPKAGSYLEGGSNLREDFSSTKSLIDSLASARQAELDDLSNISDAFKRLENARIKADVVNSILCYPSYSSMFRAAKSHEEIKKINDEFMKSVIPGIKPLIADIASDDLLDVSVVRQVMHNVAEDKNNGLAENISITPRMQELYGCYDVINELRSEASLATVQKAHAFLSTMKNKDFATELQALIAQSSRLLPGQPAFDFMLTDREGNAHRLSEFKGKPIYIDFWATWCGPCIQESPHFDALSKEFPDITFLAVSTDTSRKTWLSFLSNHKKEAPQFNTVDEVTKKDWGIYYIPRFVVIDKDFRIADAFAPVPSQKKSIVKILNSLKE